MRSESELGRDGWDRYWEDAPELAEAPTCVDSAVLKTLRDWCGPFGGTTILEAGSGSGKISRALAGEGARVVLVDLSGRAIRLSRSSFARRGLGGLFVQGSIFHMPLTDESLDLVWNEGVLEHFEPAERLQIVGEMARVCRKGGRVVSFVPYAGAYVYRLGKWLAERRGTWVFGRERPLRSMAPEFSRAGLTVEAEKTISFWGQVHFLSYVPVARWLLRLTRRVESRLEGVDRRFPGYFLATVGRKG